MPKTPSLYIIDGSSYIYRAFFAIKQHMSNSQGLSTNAIYGFTIMLLKILKTEEPDYITVAFDSKGKTFRHEQYSEYKSNRPTMPEDLSQQVPFIKKMVEVLNIHSLQKEGYEADDIIGTVVKQAEKAGFKITMVSGDKDLMQLISKQVFMLDTLKNKIFNGDDVKERFGVEPDRVIEVMGLAGDSADNIPGIPGIGEKTAKKLIQEFGSIDELVENVENIQRSLIKEKIKKFKDQALLSKKLCTIVTDLDLQIDLSDLKAKPFNNEEAINFFKELEFSSLIKEFTIKTDFSKKNYHLLLLKEEFDKVIIELSKSSFVSIDTETTHKEPMKADIVGISFSFVEDEAYYVPVAHNYSGVPNQIDKAYVFDSLRPILEDVRLKKIGQNIKYEIIVFKKNGIHLRGTDFDTMIASYIINSSRGSHSLDTIALEYLNHKTISYKEVAGQGVKEVTFDKVDLNKASIYSSEDADITLKLANLLKEKLKNSELNKLYRQIELPLVDVLAGIEMNGIKIDETFLKEMSTDLDGKLNILKDNIYKGAGREFNINSSKQLAEILFNEIGLKPVKKTKTGYSTDVGVLEKLADKHELPAQLLDYRQLNKLKSTYVDALPELINLNTGRIHTSFNQTITTTGRLSSSNPNLQNIPIRTEIGKKIREAFIAEPGFLILSADYSQIELRVLAHMSEDEVMIESFLNGEDIHKRTASEVMGIFPSMVTPEDRRIAKSVNFGIIYGISAFGLSRGVGMSTGEAKNYIDNYFARYPQIKIFMDKTIKEAYEKGFVKTLFNRRRYLADLQSSKRQVREFGERAAINTPVQGTAADIIKIAMINIDNIFKAEGVKSKMVLQVHDELVFEVLESEVNKIKKIVQETMEGVVSLKVPLIVDMSYGMNWGEAH